MKSSTSRAVAGLLILLFFGAGCASSGDLSSLRSEVRAAQATATDAKRKAEEAAAEAAAARRAAEEAAADAEAANAKADRMFRSSLEK